MKDVGEPCAGEPHARFDGRELETEHPDHGREEEATRRETARSQRLRGLPQDLPPRQLPTQPTSFTTALFDQRLDQAHARGYLDAPQHETLRATQLGRDDPEQAHARYGQVWLCVGRPVLDRVENVQLLLSRWGGEGIAFLAAEADLLGRLGRPTLVVCTVSLDASMPVTFFPNLPAILLGSYRGRRVPANAMLRRPIHPEEIETVVGPGDHLYDAHRDFPRA